MLGIRLRVVGVAGLVLAAGLVGCTGGDGSVEEDPTGSGSESSSPAGSDAPDVAPEPVGTGSDAPVPMESGLIVDGDSSPEAAADWLCLSLEAAPEGSREVVFERLLDEVEDLDQQALREALDARCADLVAPLE